ncbi:MAG: 30S ribosomal protein S1 [Thermodesulfobacteriota bacterium]
MDSDKDRPDTPEPDTPEEESFADLFDKSFVAPTRYEPGQKVVARVIKVTPEWIFLDLGRKGEGILAAKELADESGNVQVKEGDTLASYFVSSDGSEMRFTTRVTGGSAGAAHLEDAWRTGIPVDGLVVKEIKGGFEVRLPGSVRAFCPRSQMGSARSRDAAEAAGRKLPFRITQYDEKGRNIVVSNRVLVEEEERRKREESMATLAEGMVVRGKITSIRDFGAFVDIGPIEGLLPVSEIGWERVEDIREVLSPGQEVEVAIAKLDWPNKRFTFSLKKTLADPWEAAAQRFPAGSRHVGKVARLTAFGAFVSLGGGIDGLLHISRLGGGKRIKSPSEVVSVGQEVEVKVESVDAAQRRVALSLAGAEGERESPDGEAEDYRKYIERPTDAPAVGALGEALRAKMERKKKK